MNTLGVEVSDYLALRRSLGYKLAAHCRLLPQFIEFLEHRHATVITTALALEWATQPAGSVVWWHQRLAVVAGFARFLRASDHRWHVDETYVRVAGEWRYVYRAIDQRGQVIDVFVSPRRDARAAKKFFAKAVQATGSEPGEVVTDKASTYPGVLDEVLPGAFHNTVQHANNAIENDHGRLKARLRPMRGLRKDRSARM